MNPFDLGRLLPDPASLPASILLIALAITATGLVGELAFRTLRLPRITGYFVVGVLFGSWGLGVSPTALAPELRLVIDLALSVLLFELGTRVNLRWLAANPWLLVTSLVEASATFAASLAVLRLMGVDWAPAVAVSTVLIASSPAIVMRVVAEFRADGQVSQRLMLLTALNATYAVVGAKAIGGWLGLERGGALMAAVGYPLYVIVGSAVLGVALAYAIRQVVRRLDMHEDSAVLVLLGLLLLTTAIVGIAGLSTLLAPLAAGMALRLATDRPLLFPRQLGTAGGVLVALLFLITGMSVQPTHVVAGGLAALALVAARVLAKSVACAALAWPSGLSLRQGVALGVAATPASGVAFIVTAELAAGAPELAGAAGAIVFSAIAMLELAGPVALRWALAACGETDPVNR